MRTILCITTILAVAACAGGGGDSTAPPPPQAKLAFSPASYTYLPADIGGTSEGMDFTLSNIGTVAATGLSYGMSGADRADFSILSGSCTGVASLAPGASCVLATAMTPASRGAKSASLTVVSGDVALASAALSGTALAPARFMVPPSIYFGNASVSAPETLTLTVTNGGDRATAAFTVLIDGDYPGYWTITGSNCFGALAPGAHCDYTLKFAPAIPYSVSANFEIIADGSSAPVATTLIWGWGT